MADSKDGKQILDKTVAFMLSAGMTLGTGSYMGLSDKPSSGVRFKDITPREFKVCHKCNNHNQASRYYEVEEGWLCKKCKKAGE